MFNKTDENKYKPKPADEKDITVSDIKTIPEAITFDPMALGWVRLAQSIRARNEGALEWEISNA